MVNKKRKSRMFLVDEEDVIHRFPSSKYGRIYKRIEPVYLFAGKAVRFIEAHVEIEENGDEQLVGANFIMHTFDEQGLWDKNQKERALRGLADRLSVYGSSEWTELYHRWTPTLELIARTQEAVRTKKKHT